MKIFIRADSTPLLGTGHIFRTMALGRHLRSRGHEIIYLSRPMPPLIRERLGKMDFSMIDIPDISPFEREMEFTINVLKDKKADWIIVDHYNVKEKYYRQMRAAGAKILAIDDINHTYFPVDILLNQNAGAEDYTYRCDNQTIRLIGPKYALVDDVYRRMRSRARIRTNPRKILIFLGGSDPQNHTLKILRSLNAIKKTLLIDVVLGPAFAFEGTIRQAQADSPHKCHIYKNLPGLAALILNADLAIGAGGSTCWEMCALRLPMLLVPIAPNQFNVAHKLAAQGAALYPGTASEVSAEQVAQLISGLDSTTIARMSRSAGEVCDGEGVNRVTSYLSYSLHTDVILRHACPGDLKLLFKWANDPTARANSLNTSRIPWPAHQAWFKKAMGRPEEFRIFIAEDASHNPCGQIRFEKAGADATASVFVASDYRGEGLGFRLVRNGVSEITAIWPALKRIIAKVKFANSPSRTIFEKNSFHLANAVRSPEYCEYIKERNHVESK